VGEPVNTQGTQTYLSLVYPIYDQIFVDQKKVDKIVQEETLKRKIEEKVNYVRSNAKYKLKKAATKIRSMKLMNKIAHSKNLAKTKKLIMREVLGKEVHKLNKNMSATSLDNVSVQSFDEDEIRPTVSLLQIKKHSLVR
jgi:hypothetical protein